MLKQIHVKETITIDIINVSLGYAREICRSELFVWKDVGRNCLCGKMYVGTVCVERCTSELFVWKYVRRNCLCGKMYVGTVCVEKCTSELFVWKYVRRNCLCGKMYVGTVCVVFRNASSYRCFIIEFDCIVMS